MVLFRATQPDAQWLADIMNQYILEFIIAEADRQRFVVLDERKEIDRWADDGGRSVS